MNIFKWIFVAMWVVGALATGLALASATLTAAAITVVNGGR